MKRQQSTEISTRKVCYLDGNTNIHTVLLLPEVYSSGIQHSHLQVIQLISTKTRNVQAVLLGRDYTEERAAIQAVVTSRKD